VIDVSDTRDTRATAQFDEGKGGARELVATPAVTTPSKSTSKFSKTKLFSMFVNKPSLWSSTLLVLLVIVFSLISSNFFSQASWVAIALTVSATLILAFGEVFVIIVGGIDISYAGNICVCSVAGGLVMGHYAGHGMNSTLAILIGLVVMLAIGLFIGLINGIVIARLGVNAFIATFAMSTAALGAGELLNNGADVDTIPSSILNFGNNTILGGWVPIPIIVTIVVGIIAAVVLHRLKFGRWTYLIGSNQAACRRAGIPVERHLIKVYMLSGLLSAVAAFLIVARLGIATPDAGTGDELAAVAMCVIGGASLFGGRGGIAGCFVGGGIVTVLQVGLIIAGLETFWQSVATGFIVVLAVWADQQRIKIQTRMVIPESVSVGPDELQPASKS
jgi:ribose transport system permease protein